MPRYAIGGTQLRSTSVAALAKYKSVFEDPEVIGKGRFYNCPVGWQCEVVNSRKLRAYGLADAFVNYRPASASSLDEAILDALSRRKPILFYYWAPTWLLVEKDLVQLKEPAFNPKAWRDLLRLPNSGRATAFPRTEVVIGASKHFVSPATQELRFLKRIRISSGLISESLAKMHRDNLSPYEAAREFYRGHQSTWRSWFSPEASERLRRALSQ